MGNELPLAEERRGAAVGILEPMEQLGGEHSQTGADEASEESVETILIVQREEDKVILGRKSGSNSITNLGEGDEAVPGIYI